MRLFRTVPLLLLALLVSVVPASLHAQVFISVNFAPPELPVYEQPMCPQPNLLWEPGYWAYADDDYFWVPGAWVPAPYEGALWTPGYWGWNDGNYAYNEGYWGSQVGYYGGVNYGGGYLGIGFAGGEWRGGDFAYNTAVVNVNTTIIHTTYINRTIIQTNTVASNRVAYSGGPGGVQHRPTSGEQAAMNQPHTPPTTYQAAHVVAAKADTTSFAKANGGRPKTLVAARPLVAATQAPPPEMKAGANAPAKAEPREASRPEVRAVPQAEPKAATRAEPKPAPREAPKPEARPAPQAEPKAAPRAEPRPAPREAPRPEARPAPQAEPKAAPRAEPRPSPREAPKPGEKQK